MRLTLLMVLAVIVSGCDKVPKFNYFSENRYEFHTAEFGSNAAYIKTPIIFDTRTGIAYALEADGIRVIDPVNNHN